MLNKKNDSIKLCYALRVEAVTYFFQCHFKTLEFAMAILSVFLGSPINNKEASFPASQKTVGLVTFR